MSKNVSTCSQFKPQTKKTTQNPKKKIAPKNANIKNLTEVESYGFLYR